MAMSQKAGAYSGSGSNLGRTNRNRPRLPPNRTFFDDFRPVSEWKTEKDALILLVRLPGFLKEQVNCSKDESKRFIRIYGERALADNRRLRFNTTYSIPQNCNFNQITTHFDGGILTITIPKLPDLTTTPNIPQQNQEASASQEKPTIKLQKSDEEISSFGTEKQENEVAGKTLSEKGSKATGVDHDREAKEESLELKKEHGADKKTQDKEMVLLGRLQSEVKNKSEADTNESKEENEVKKQRRTKTENAEMATKGVESNEEKQLVVNICAAAMVIIGLGLELFTTFR